MKKPSSFPVFRMRFGVYHVIMSLVSRRHFLNTSGATLFATQTLGQEANSKRIKAAQIGTKHPHAAGKFTTMLDLDDIFEVVGLCEEDNTQRERVSTRRSYQSSTWLTEDQILGDPEVKLVAIETDIDHLVPTALRCLKAGKHIHLDKPAGQKLAPCKEMHHEADRRGLTIQMGYMLRYNPAFEFLFKIVKEGWLGEITEVHGHMGKKASSGLRKELSQYPGGGLFELACHLIDALVTILGKPNDVHGVHVKTQRDAFKDNQIATFQFDRALATIGSNHNDPFGGPRRQFTVVGTEGTLAIQPLEPPKVSLALTKDRGKLKRGTQQIPMPKTEGRYHGEFRDLAKIVKGEKSLAWNSEHDLIVQEALMLASGLSLDD